MTAPPYTQDPLTAREAQRHALEIVFGPITFQVARVMRKIGMLELLAAPPRDTGKGLDALCQVLDRPRYPVQVLVEAALSSGILSRHPAAGEEPERYCLTKAGYMLHQDAMTGVLMDFVQDVCYRGMYDLEQALETGTPAGLKRFGDWPTLYAGLSALPEAMRRSWFGYDHYFSDCTFPAALAVVFDPPPRTVLDIGGNTGKWALHCVAHDPAVQVTVIDLPPQLGLMAAAIAGQDGAERISGRGVDLLDPAAALPDGFEVIWMSQFLDCFGEADIIRILRLAAAAMTAGTRLYINEVYWDRQRFETASFVLMQSSPYFTAMANGRSKFLYWPDMQRCLTAAGLTVEHNRDGLGWGHTLTCCRRADSIDRGHTA